MNLKEEWNAMQQEMQQEVNYKTDLNSHSVNLYDRLLKGLTIKRYWCFAFALFFLLSMFLVDVELLKYLGWAMASSYFFTAYQLKHQIKQLSIPIDYNAPLKNLLTENLLKFERILRVERIFGMLIAPFIGPIMVVVLHLLKYKTLGASVEQSHYFFYFLFGAVLLAVPIYYLGTYMTKVAFGIDLKALRQNIKEMEGEDVEFLKIPL